MSHGVEYSSGAEDEVVDGIGIAESPGPSAPGNLGTKSFCELTVI